MANRELMSSLGKLDEAIRELNAQGIGVEYSIKKEPKQDYEVMIRRSYIAVVPIKAISASSAKAMVIQAIQEGKIHLDFVDEPDDISVWATERSEI